LCANTLCLLFAVLCASPIPAADEGLSDILAGIITVPEGIIDAEISGEGDIYVLLPGLPHLRIYAADGSISEYDLHEVQLPGGMYIDERWGWYVTGEITDMIYRYDSAGELAESWNSGSLPGDICLSGLSTLYYVSRGRGAVFRLDESDEMISRLDGSCRGQLSVSGREAVYSDADESILFGSYTAPVPLPQTGIWVIAGDWLLVLQDSCVIDGSGTTIFQLSPPGQFSRISFSINGNHCLLWTPGEGRILVLQ